MPYSPIDKIIQEIKQNKSFLITAHDNLDGDAFGSGLALCFALNAMGKRVKFLLKTPIPKRYSFLPGIKKFVTDKVDKKKYNALFVLDTAGWDQLEKINPNLFKHHSILNIDHHIDNLKIGTVNWIDIKASAVGEQIYALLKKIKAPITKDIAECLYTSIVTDTGCFQFTNTTPATHIIASSLIRSGACPALIYEQIYETMSLARLNLLKCALKSLKTDTHKQIIWIWITQKMFKDTGTDKADTEGFIDYIRAVKGIKVAIVFKESAVKNEIRVTFRSKVSEIRVNEIAHKFNGGGHPAAAGCTIQGTPKEVEKRVISAVKEAIK